MDKRQLAKKIYAAYKESYPTLTEEYVYQRLTYLENNRPQNIMDMLIREEINAK